MSNPKHADVVLDKSHFLKLLWLRSETPMSMPDRSWPIPRAFPKKRTNESYFAAFFLVGLLFEGLAFALFFAALDSAISANNFSIRRI